MAKYKVRLRPLAADDLKSLHLWIEERAGGAVADAYLRRIEAFYRRLDQFPGRGAPRPELGKGMRSVVFERHLLVLYRVEADLVRILRFIDGAQDFGPADLNS